VFLCPGLSSFSLAPPKCWGPHRSPIVCQEISIYKKTCFRHDPWIPFARNNDYRKQVRSLPLAPPSFCSVQINKSYRRLVMKGTTRSSFTTDLYDCPQTGQTETVEIEHTTKSRPSSRSANAAAISFTRRNLREYTGLDTCGVKTSYSSGMVTSESFAWDLCPLITTLNKG